MAEKKKSGIASIAGQLLGENLVKGLPLMLIRFGVGALVLGLTQIPTYMLRMKVSKLAHENAVMEQAGIAREKDKEIADLEAQRAREEANVVASRVMSSKLVAEILKIQKESEEQIELIRKAATWAEILLK